MKYSLARCTYTVQNPGGPRVTIWETKEETFIVFVGNTQTNTLVSETECHSWPEAWIEAHKTLTPTNRHPHLALV